jgi:excisionase family DNA binding protein
MHELDDSTLDLSTELRWLRQAIGDLAGIITDKLDVNGPAVLDMQEAARYLSTTRRALHALRQRGGLPCRRIGRKYIFLKAELDAWLQALPGITVAQAIAAIKPEHREVWVKGSVRMRYAEPERSLPAPPLVRGPRRHLRLPSTEDTTLVRGPRGTNRERLKAEAALQKNPR